MKVKLKSIIFLKQETKCRIQLLSDQEKIEHLFRNIYRPRETDLLNQVVKVTDQLIKQIDMVLFECIEAKESVMKIYDYLYGRGTK